MSKDLVIQDTCDVIITDPLNNNFEIGIGYAQIAGIEQTVAEDDLRGGIGNKLVYVLRSSKDITLNVTSATFKPEFLALMSGTTMEKFKKDIMTMRTLKAEEGATAGELVLKLPTGTDVNVVRVEYKGKQYDLDVANDEVELDTTPTTGPFADLQAGDELECFTIEKDVDVEGFKFLTDKFAHKFGVKYRTITYDQATAAPHSEIFFEFPETIPSGNFNLALQNGEAYIPELNFRVTAPKGTNELGTMYHRPIPAV